MSNQKRRFSACLNNVLFDNLMSECCLQKARYLFRCQRYHEAIAECDQGLALRGDCLSLLRKRGETFCLLQMYDKVCVCVSCDHRDCPTFPSTCKRSPTTRGWLRRIATTRRRRLTGSAGSDVESRRRRRNEIIKSSECRHLSRSSSTEPREIDPSRFSRSGIASCRGLQRRNVRFAPSSHG